MDAVVHCIKDRLIVYGPGGVAEDVVPRVFHVFCKGRLLSDHLAPQPGAVRAAGDLGMPE